MRKLNHLTLFLSFLCAICILVITTGLASRPDQTGPNGNATKDFSHFPIVEFNTKEPSDPDIRAKRELKGQKYRARNLPPISESTDQIFTNYDWDVGLPALPVERSAVIVIGKIIRAEAHLVPDKTRIYSEFAVEINQVVKNDSETPLDVGRTVTVERLGGRVRMPSGKLVLSWVNHQNMPRVGGRYVLFLTHDFETRGDMGKDYYILTGYELRENKVFPLDDTLPSHAITAYKGTAESKFLSDLFREVGKASDK